MKNFPIVKTSPGAPIYDEAQAYLAAIIQSADDPIISKDLNGIITSWNPAAERLFGYSAEEIVGKPVLTFIPPDRVAEESMILERIRAGKAIDHLETVRLRKDGARLQVSLTVSPVKDADGNVIGASKITRDITGVAARMRQQRVVAELGQNALQENDLQKIFDRATNDIASTLGVSLTAVLQVLPDGEELLLQAGTGWEKSLIGKAKTSAHPGTQANFTLLSEEPIVVDNLPEEKRFSYADILQTHEATSGISCVIMGEKKEPWGVLSAFSKEKRKFDDDHIAFLQAIANVLAATVQRHATDRRFRLAFEAAPNGMVLIDESGTIQMANRQMERIFGYTRQEITGRPISSLIPDIHDLDDPQKASNFPLETFDHGHDHGLFGRRKDGSEFSVETGLNRAETTEGVFVLAAITDISNRKRMETELAEAHSKLSERALQLEALVAQRTEHLQQTIEELESVSYSLSHDMRAPLRTIHSFSQILLEEADEQLNSEQKSILGRVITSAARLDRLIQDVLVLSRISRDAVSLAETDLESLLDEIILERPEFHSPRANIKIERPLAKILAHEAYLTQSITNLLDNAVKFVRPGRTPEIRIWTETQDGKVNIYFEDNGPGIPEEARGRIFEMFQRIHGDNQFSGTGIGLAIVDRAVKKMGGSVSLESSVDQGSRFCIQLQKAES